MVNAVRGTRPGSSEENTFDESVDGVDMVILWRM